MLEDSKYWSRQMQKNNVLPQDVYSVTQVTRKILETKAYIHTSQFAFPA